MLHPSIFGYESTVYALHFPDRAFCRAASPYWSGTFAWMDLPYFAIHWRLSLLLMASCLPRWELSQIMEFHAEDRRKVM
jgi:hypothetical protein